MRLVILVLLSSTSFAIDPFELIYGIKDTVFGKVDKVKTERVETCKTILLLLSSSSLSALYEKSIAEVIVG